MFLHRDRRHETDQEERSPVQDTELILSKQRNGPIGDIHIAYLPSYTKFENKTDQTI